MQRRQKGRGLPSASLRAPPPSCFAAARRRSVRHIPAPSLRPGSRGLGLALALGTEAAKAQWKPRLLFRRVSRERGRALRGGPEKEWRLEPCFPLPPPLSPPFYAFPLLIGCIASLRQPWLAGVERGGRAALLLGDWVCGAGGPQRRQAEAEITTFPAPFCLRASRYRSTVQGAGPVC